MDLTNDIPDFVKCHFENPTNPQQSFDPFQQKWNDLGQFVKQQFFTGGSTSGLTDVTLRSFIACAPLGSCQLQGTLWSCTFLPPHVKLTSWTYMNEQKFYEQALDSQTIITFEAPFVHPKVFQYGLSELIAIPEIACVQTIFFLVSRMFVQHNHIPEPVSVVGVGEKRKCIVASSSTLQHEEDEENLDIVSTTYSEVPIQAQTSVIPNSKGYRHFNLSVQTSTYYCDGGRRKSKIAENQRSRKSQNSVGLHSKN